MDTRQTKPNYLPPQIKAVSFQVELGTLASQTRLSYLPFEDDLSTGQSYNTVRNSGGGFFSGGDENLAPGSTGSDYNPFDWEW